MPTTPIEEVEELDNENLDAGGELETPEEAAADEPDPAAAAEAEADALAKVLEMLGEPGDDDIVDLTSLNERTIADMPPEARHIIRALKRVADKRAAHADEVAQATLRQAEAVELSVKEQQRELGRSRAAFAEMFGNPKIRKLIAEGKKVDVDKLDPTTPEGMRSIAKKEMAEALGEFAEPIQEHALKAQREARRQAVVEKYADDFADPTFKDDVNAVIVGWEKAGEDPAGRLDEAVREAKLRRMMAAETQRKARRADAAARSQRQVARASGGGGGSTIEGPPAHIRSNPDAMTDWVARNPKQAIAYANSLRG
ncbi:MAG TPA: hypothetical protein VI911_04330 [Patescibacteria group bacterium]|nr:hypothetical protein [Patescibacteria group bacterium]